ncbi:MAG: holo-[acyl-carrier-protein] synthase [Chlamydiae bacterium]|nr:holo-[acyl-carrier-protein] synthase [Chlamydiota bacterium]
MNNILGVGTDIIEIERFKDVMKDRGQKFLDKVFSKQEQEYCLRYSDPTSRFAVRFSAKEAVVKALGVGFGKEVSFLDIEILNDPSGKPLVILSPKCQALFQNPVFHISLSHSKFYATATAIAVTE